MLFLTDNNVHRGVMTNELFSNRRSINIKFIKFIFSSIRNVYEMSEISLYARRKNAGYLTPGSSSVIRVMRLVTHSHTHSGCNDSELHTVILLYSVITTRVEITFAINTRRNV